MMETIPEEEENCSQEGKVIYLQLKAIPIVLSKKIKDRQNVDNETAIIENIGDKSFGNNKSDLSNLQNFQQRTEVKHNSEILLSIPVEIRSNIVNEQQKAIKDKTLERESEPQGFEMNRTGTDTLWLFFFLSFSFAWLCLGFYVGASSKTTSFFSTHSSYKKECPSSDKRFLMHFSLANYFKNAVISSLTDLFILSKFCPTGKVCVAECPTKIWTAELFLKHILPFNQSLIQPNLICVRDEIKKNITTLDILEDFVNKNLCMREYSPNVPVLNLCLPYEFLMNLTATKFKWNVVINIAELIYLCMLENLLFLQIIFTSTCLLLMIYVCLLQWIAAPLWWFSTISFLFCSMIAFIYTALGYFGIESNDLLKHYKVWFIEGGSVLSLISFILAAILFLVVIKKVVDLIRLKHYINPGLILIKESCKIIRQTKGSLFFIFLVIHLYFGLALWAWNVVICLLNDSNQDYQIQNLNILPCNCTGEYQNAIEGNKCRPEKFYQFCSNCICSKPDEIKLYFVVAIQIFNVFAVIWTIFFIHTFSKMVLAYSLCRWYYNIDKKELLPFLIITSTKTIVRYHLGTAAYGSFGILQSAICKIIMVLKMCPNLKHLTCSIDMKVSAPMHKYSLISCAVHGTDMKNSTEKLCSSIVQDEGWKGLNKVTQKILNLIKWIICCVLMILLFFIPNKKTYCLEIAHHFLYFCIYLISTIYVQVCKIVAESLMYCYIQDQNSKNKRKLIPEGLKNFFEKQESLSCKNIQDQDSYGIWASMTN
ncbi:choline transporter-like 2 isoform X2 [Halyomorpha halys]|uniref:choline transporter-like 2 isoform X2 n=1 Tax=Halyomorpha halys TaxID=286706 RepID=UPI0034D22745